MALVGYIILFALIILIELKRKKIYKFDFLFFINGYFFLVYALVPIIMINGDTAELVDSKLLGALHYFGDWKTPLILLLSYLLILFGYYLKFSKSSNQYLIKLKLSSFSIVLLNYFGILVVIASMIIYVNSFGGFIETAINAELIRNRVIEPPKFAFVKTFWKISPFILLFSYYKIFFYRDKNIFHYKILFFLSLLIFLSMIPLNNGRGFILFTILNLYLFSVIVTGRYYLKAISLVSIFGLIIIVFADSFFYAIPVLINEGFDAFVVTLSTNISNISNDSSTGFFHTLASNASHPIISLELSLNQSGYGIPFRYFYDSYVAIFSILPESLIGIELPKNIAYLNTLLIWQSERGAIPPGLIGYFSYSLGIIGIFIGSFLYGFIAGFLQRFFYNNYYPIFMFLLAFGYGAAIFNGDPLIFMSANLLLFMVLFVFLVNSKIVRKGVKT